MGYQDDLLILPPGIIIALKMIPAEVMRDCRAKASAATPGVKPAAPQPLADGPQRFPALNSNAIFCAMSNIIIDIGQAL